MDIRKIQYVNVREIWRNEAKDFTTWLAENMDYLEDSLGFHLNAIETERQIGSFNVDIYCEDERGNAVIIENQLEQTDHKHLGQIMTYTVGAAASTIIWISPQPREEHIAVIEWLNEVTPVDMNWFLFKLDAIRISDSQVSPLFTKVCSPSQEIKTLGTEKKDLAERHLKRIRFWEELLPVVNSKSSLFKNISPSKDNWLSAGTGIGAVYYQIVVKMDCTLILLVIGTKSAEANKQMYDALYIDHEKIDFAFGETITWRRMDDQISSRIQHEILECNLKDESTWKDGHELIASALAKWGQVFKPYLNKISKM